MNTFQSIPLTGVLADRFTILTNYVGSNEWWTSIFDCGVCIAGGAAMFVADDSQCIAKVGDIDIWFPRTMDVTPLVESMCKWLDQNGIDHRIVIQTHIVTIYNPIINIQFVCAMKEKNLTAILDGFDYDCDQCAIYGHTTKQLRSGKELFSLHLLVSSFAQEAHQSRKLKWINLRKWRFAKFPQMSNELDRQRQRQRLAKLQEKGFNTFPGPKIVHNCNAFHRDPSEEYWNLMTSIHSQRFDDCKEKIILTRCEPKPAVNIDLLRQQGLEINEEDVDFYIAAMLESLKLDEATFKTAVIEFCNASDNRWVQISTLEN